MLAIAIAFLILILLFLAERRLYKRLWLRGLSADIKFSHESLTVGQKGALIETIRNDKWLPLPNIRVKFHVSRKLKFIDTDVTSSVTDYFYRNDLFAMGVREEIKRTIPFEAVKRGFYELKEVDLIGSDIFFSSHMVAKDAVSTELYVYPQSFESELFSRILVNINGDISTKRALVSDPFSFIGIREYAPSDDRRLINQKASAKGAGLMVSVPGFANDITARIVMDLTDNGVFKHPKAYEAAVSIALGLAIHLSQMGVQFSFVSNGRDFKSHTAQSLGFGVGDGHIFSLKQILSRIDEDAEVDVLDFDFKSNAKSQLTFFISVGAFAQLVDGIHDFIAENDDDFYWIFPVQGYDDPLVPADLKDNISFIYIDR